MKCYYHNDADGRCAAAIVYQFLQTGAQAKQAPAIDLIEMDYNRTVDVNAISKAEPIIIVDFSFKPDVMAQVLAKTDAVTWIDHHKTAKVYDYGRDLMGLRHFSEPGKSGALLAWLYCYPGVQIPRAVELVSDYDTWQHKIAGDKEFNLGLMAQPWASDPSNELWEDLFESHTGMVDQLIKEGLSIRRFRDTKCEDYCRSYGFETEIGGYKAYAVNLYTFGSHTFGERMKQYPICAGFVFDGKQFTVSLYSDTGVDTSMISKGYGGGGHSAASGFQCAQLPFHIA